MKQHESSRTQRRLEMAKRTKVFHREKYRKEKSNVPGIKYIVEGIKKPIEFNVEECR